MSEFDLSFLSQAMAMVGLFFICVAVLQKKPKHVLEEAFGVGSGAVRELKSAVFKKNQLILGYLWIMLAIVLNIFSEAIVRADGTTVLDKLNALTLAAALIGVVAVLCAVLNYLSRLFSKWQFRKIVKDVITERHLPFESNVPLTLELGQLLGVQREAGDSVEAYIARLRKNLDIPQPQPAQRRNSRTGSIGLEFR
ncbi:MAG TPA: hypothetical protein PKA37_05585 [Planctomycetota bacterium]|jgi:preprotein translocase subunit SecG|nr:hypothetical protein [Planctomycetota bacterium]